MPVKMWLQTVTISSRLFGSRSKSLRNLSTSKALYSGGLSFDLSDEHKEIQQVARKFTLEEIIPIAAHHDKTGEYPHEIAKKAWKLGFLNGHIPQQYGGSQLGAVAECIINEELGFGCTGILTAVTANNLAQAPVVLFGNDAQKKKYLTRMVEEPLYCAYCVTEPGTGSDVGGVRTRAVRKGDSYVINGQKNVDHKRRRRQLVFRFGANCRGS